MVLGTASDVGKSIVAAALCRLFAKAGYRVAPFKAQNMSLNAAVTPEGGEIGRAQALQAEAAGIASTVDMNPILLKPSSDQSSQIVVRGRVWGHSQASDYHTSRVHDLFPIVVESYRRLASEYDVVVLEGAGSPAEINLKENDIVNMRMAEAADAACLLVGDIDRGGVFASLLGTLELLDPAERARIQGVLINKFRGDIRLLSPGLQMLEQRIGTPCFGVIPYLHDLGLDEEDSVALESYRSKRGWPEETSSSRALRVAVLDLPFLSNFTDFDCLLAEPSVALRFVRRAQDIAGADLLIVPGTKQTISDLRWLRANAFLEAIASHAKDKLTIGICGGMQILGRAVHDPLRVEGGGDEGGIGLLPLQTILAAEKTAVLSQASLELDRLFGRSVSQRHTRGYEIHAGETKYDAGATRLFEVKRLGRNDAAIADGAISPDGRVLGTYLHGFLDDDDFRHSFLRAARQALGLTPAVPYFPWKADRERRLDRLAEEVASNVDLRAIWKCLDLPYTTTPQPEDNAVNEHS